MEKRKTKTTGLVLGKFAPFHKGHQLLVEAALETVDRVIVLIYETDVTTIPLNVRADWIRTIYPQVTVIEGWGGPQESGHAKRIMRLQEEYVKNIIKKPITHLFSSEWYGAHMSKALGAENVMVDRARKIVPISARRIRKNPHRYRAFMHTYVYKNFVEKVVFLGAESTGKSTLAEYMAKKYKTEWMPEYGRAFWMRYRDADGKLTKKQLTKLACEHLERENKKLLLANHYLFVDTNAITTEMFSHHYHNSVDSELKNLARDAEGRYNYWFVCATDIPYHEDGTRSGARHRLQFQMEILANLKTRGISYTLLLGTLRERSKKVEKILNRKNPAANKKQPSS